MLTPEQKRGWEDDGFFIIRGSESPATCRAFHQRAIARTATATQGIQWPTTGRALCQRLVEIARTAAWGLAVANVLIVREKNRTQSAETQRTRSRKSSGCIVIRCSRNWLNVRSTF